MVNFGYITSALLLAASSNPVWAMNTTKVTGLRGATRMEGGDEVFLSSFPKDMVEEAEAAVRMVQKSRSQWWFTMPEAGLYDPDDPPRSGDPNIDIALSELEVLMDRARESSRTTNAMQQSINEMHQKMFEAPATTPPSGLQVLHDNAKHATAAARAVFGAWDKFESGEPDQIIIGSMEVLAAASGAVPGLGPFIQFGAVMVGGIFGLNRDSPVEESMESVVDRVVREALRDARQEDLLDELEGLIRVMRNDLMFAEFELMHTDRTEDQLSDLRESLIAADGFDPNAYSRSTEFLGRLESRINRSMNTLDKNEADRTAALISAYVSVYILRERLSGAIALLFGSIGNDRRMDFIFNDRAEDWRVTPMNLLRALHQGPDDRVALNDPSVRRVFSSLHTSISREERLTVEAFMETTLGMPVPGWVFRLQSNEWPFGFLRAEGRIVSDRAATVASSQTNLQSSLFRVIGSNQSFKLFAIGSDTFVWVGGGGDGLQGRSRHLIPTQGQGLPHEYHYDRAQGLIATAHNLQNNNWGVGIIGPSSQVIGTQMVGTRFDGVEFLASSRDSRRAGDTFTWTFRDEFGNPVRIFGPSLYCIQQNQRLPNVCACNNVFLFSDDAGCDEYSTQLRLGSGGF